MPDKPIEIYRKSYNYLLILNALFFSMLSVINLSISRYFLSFLWGSGSILWIINYFWSKKTAYIRITRDEIMLFPNMVKPPRIFRRNEIKTVSKVGKRKVDVTLADQTKIRILLSFVSDKDKETVTSILENDVSRLN